MGFVESLRIIRSYLYACLFPYRQEETLEQWVCNRFGARLYRVFFKTYTEKVWGVPCSEIHADWAAQRIKGLSFLSAIKNAIFQSRDHGVKSLISSFHYLERGPGQMWQMLTGSVCGSAASKYCSSTASCACVTRPGELRKLLLDPPQARNRFPVQISSVPCRFAAWCARSIPRLLRKCCEPRSHYGTATFSPWFSSSIERTQYRTIGFTFTIPRSR